MRIDPVSLRLFVYVAQEGTIAAGANKLSIVNSAASKRLHELELALDAQLLRRTNRGVEPTAAGLTLMGLAQEVLADLDSIKLRMRDYAKGLKGQVRILASQSAISQALPIHLASFAMEHPGVRVSFEERENPAILKALRENSYDVGVSIASAAAPDLREIPYYRYRLAAVVPRSHKLTKAGSVKFSDFLDYPQIGLQSDGAASAFFQRMAAAHGRTINYRINVESYQSLLLMVHAGLGVGIVPSTVLDFFSSNLAIEAIELEDDWAAERILSIYHRANEKLSATSKLLVEHLWSSSNIALQREGSPSEIPSKA
jgi:DNA-binding transcriptional LysR family regulator